MSDRVFESAVRVLWDPGGAKLVLVDWGDELSERVTLDGGQLVDVVPRIRAAGVMTFPRGNEQHRISFEKSTEQSSLGAAFSERLRRSLALPRSRADVLLWFEAGSKYRLKAATIESWPSRQDALWTRERVNIVGGVLITDSGTYTGLTTWS
jgi:hypothetical protein